MHDPSNGFVVIISALLTLLVLGGATLAVGFRNGWLHVGADASSRDAVTALAQLTDAERSPTVPTARDAKPAQPLEAADQSEVAVHTQKLEEACVEHSMMPTRRSDRCRPRNRRSRLTEP